MSDESNPVSPESAIDLIPPLSKDDKPYPQNPIPNEPDGGGSMWYSPEELRQQGVDPKQGAIPENDPLTALAGAGIAAKVASPFMSAATLYTPAEQAMEDEYLKSVNKESMGSEDWKINRVKNQVDQHVKTPEDVEKIREQIPEEGYNSSNELPARIVHTILDRKAALLKPKKKFADGGDVTPQPAPQPTPTPAPSGMQYQAPPPEGFDDLSPSGELPPQGFNDLGNDEEEAKYTSPLQQVGAAAEGLGKGFAGPVATAAELGLSKLGVPGMSAEEQTKREQYNPELETVGKVGGTIAGLATGVGELAGVAKGAGAIAKAANLGKFGSTVLKTGIEGGLLQGGDEISKAMLGQGDPEAPVASALTHMGAASLLGGGLGVLVGGAGAGVRALGDSPVGQKAAKFMGDFGRQWKFIQGNLDPVESATNEVNGRMAETEQMMKGGLKGQLIDKLTQDVSPEDVNSHLGQVSNALRTAPAALKNEPTFQAAVQDWESKVTQSRDPMTLQPINNPSPGDVFRATDNLKRQMQEWGQYNKLFTPVADRAWMNASRGVADTLKTSLEDSDVWGPMGKAQADINSKLAPMFDIQKEFQGKFASKEMGDKVADPQKINTYLYQVNRASGKSGLKTNYVSNYLDQTQNLAEAFNKVHADNGIEAPFAGGLKPTPVLEHSLDPSPTAGAKMADWLGSTGYPTLAGQIASKTVGKGIGAAAGYVAGGLPGIVPGALGEQALEEHLAPILKNAIGEKLNKYAVPAALKVLSSGETSGIPEALQHAENVAKGSSKIKKAIDGLFTTPAGPQQVYNTASIRDREKLNTMIADGELNKQIQKEAVSASQPMPQPSQSPQPPQGFAEGGEVKANTPDQGAQQAEPQSPLGNPISTHFPAQAMMLASAKGRVSNYLNALRPQPNQMKLPFDKDMHIPEQKRTYNNALDIANDPLSVLHHVKQGTITPEHLTHLKSMYPEVHSHLSKKITQRISEDQMKGKTVPYRTRAGLSMFMGTPLDSSFTPAAIQAAQPQAPQPQPQTAQQPASKPKRSMNALNKLPDQYKTAGQSAESDRGDRS